MTRLPIAIVGLGPACEPHARSLADLADRVDVRHAVSRTAERTRAFSERFAFPTTTDLDAVIAEPDLRAVFVLTPANTHLDIAERCMRAGKDVLVEKPLEVSLERAERLVETARRLGRTLGVVLQYRFRPASLRLREILVAGRLGRIEAASMTVPWWRPQSYYDEPGRGSLTRDGGGVLLTQAIHTLDLFRSLLGVREVVAAQVTKTALHRMETEDYAAALVQLGNGAPGSVVATTAAYPGGPERLEIIGTRGTASLIGGRLQASYLDGGQEVVQAEGSTGSGANIMDFPHDAHRALIANFIDAIREGRDPQVTGEEALATQRLIGEILARGGFSPQSASS